MKHSNSGNDPPKSGGRFCLYCGKDIDYRMSKAIFCSDTCRNKAKIKSRPFIALDGEGIANRYILLAAKNRKLKLKQVSDLNGLSTKTCLDFLLSLPKGSKGGTRPLYIWFAFDYDVNMILGDLPLKGETASIEELRRENQTVWQGYKITYIPRKIFKLKYNGRTFHSVDVWSFFATTFEAACQQWNVETPSIIGEGKQARKDFSTWEIAKIQEYNAAELNALAELAEQLREAFSPLALPIRSWHGPGACASAWLSKNKAAKHLGEIPKDLYDAATRAYFGGRIDAGGYGFIDPVFHYDLVSAYPSAIRFLPDLSKLKWQYAKGRPPSGSSLFVAHIRWKIPATKWGVLPWRSRQGIIRYPRSGEGWYWQAEYETAAARFPDCLEVIGCWFTNEPLSLPFKSLIEEAFHYRAELKREGKPSHLAVKLILNSLYGKFAQTVGRAQYYSPIWAGMITAHTRAEISKVISDDVVCTMTDGVWSSKPLQVNYSNDLGAWEKQDESILILAEAGLYQAKTPDGKTTIWQRGFDKRKPLDITGIVEKWLTTDPAFQDCYTVTRFVGMGLASMTHFPWRHWVEFERRIQPVPLVGTTKRLPLYPIQSEAEKREGFQPLGLRAVDEEVCSYPYSKLVLDPELTKTHLQDETHS